MKKYTFLALTVALLSSISACSKYSPNTYSSTDMQQVNKVDKAVVKSFRSVDASDPALGFGTAVGGVSGAVLGSQIGKGSGSAVAGVGGALAGAAIGSVVEHEATKTTAFEYLLQKPNGDLVSLAQKQDVPFAAGTHVLIIYGVQARIILDSNPSN